VIERQQASGQSIVRFCSENGLAPALFYAWKRRLAINNSGSVGGQSTATSTGNYHAFLCTDRLRDLGTLGSSSLRSTAWGVNDGGQVVGFADVSSQAGSVFVWTEQTGMLDVWKLIDWKYSDSLPTGTTGGNIHPKLYINDHYVNAFGQVSGTISLDGVGNVPFILTPK
jgi:probable HAF family extracellular repeat protein